MGTFIQNNLGDGEKIVYKAKVHWFIYIEAISWFMMIFLVAVFSKAVLGMTDMVIMVVAGVMMIVVIKKAAAAFMHQYFTEMAITNRRIIAKFGFIRRDVIELPLERIESVVIDQSVMERMMDAGSVAVRGTGTAMAPVRFIDDPIEFRNKLNEAISHAKNSGGAQ